MPASTETPSIPLTVRAGERMRDRPLHIGLMLRGVDEVDGAGVYARRLYHALFDIDHHNRYTLFLSAPAQRGLFGDRPNVREVVVRAPAKILWDQVAMPIAARRERLDLLFHHKFTIPLVSPCPTVVQQRTAEYWTHPHYYDWPNRLYNYLFLPLYCRRATRVLTNSDTLADELHRYLKLPRQRLHTVHAAADARFRPITDAATLAAVRARHGLPPGDFLLMVVKGYARLGKSHRTLYPSKNIHGTLEAYAQLRQRMENPPPVVIVGSGVSSQLLADAGFPDLDGVHLIGLIPHDDMPALYSMARALAFPSFYESFGIPIVEAMACGCPTITSRPGHGACAEVAGDAAILVDPWNSAEIADAIERVMTDDVLAGDLRARGIARARHFSWEESARRLLAELHAAVRDGR